MKEENFFLPEAQLEKFRKFIAKAENNIQGLHCEIGKVISKQFNHYQNDKNGSGTIAMFHNVAPVTIIMPEVGDWELEATVLNSLNSIEYANLSQEVHFKNPEHGVDYGICDACKHPVRVKSFVILNTRTGKEMQVGSECIKKYGLNGILKISSFISELTAEFEFTSDTGDEGRIPIWNFNHADPKAAMSINLIDAVKVGKKYYDEHGGKWIKGYSINDYEYQPSESKQDIENMLKNNEVEGDDEYAKKVIEYIRSIKDSKSEFMDELLSVFSNFYIPLNKAFFGFWGVKTYENHLVTDNNIKNFSDIISQNNYEVGKEIPIEGTVTDSHFYNDEYSRYGGYTVYTIKLDNGLMAKRAGVVHEDQNGKIKGFAIIKKINVNNGIIVLDRITKNPILNKPVRDPNKPVKHRITAAKEFYDGFAIVKYGNKYNFINKEKQILYKPNNPEQWFDSAYDFSNGSANGFATVELNKKWYLLNTQGQLCDYNTKQPISELNNESRIRRARKVIRINENQLYQMVIDAVRMIQEEKNR